MKQKRKNNERKRKANTKVKKTKAKFRINKFFALFTGLAVILAITYTEIHTHIKDFGISSPKPDAVYASADTADELHDIIVNDNSGIIDKGTAETNENLIPNSGSEKVAYLTFDDGPSDIITPQILDILKSYNIKATFFVLGSSVEANPAVLRRIHSEGHKIANHSYSHVYKNIYSSVGALLNEINATNDIINQTLGFYYGNTIFRFPGGSFDKPDYFKNSINETGFKYIDWNCLGNDAVSGTKTADEIFTQTVNTSINKNPLTILLHDTNAKQTTVDALPRIIEYLIAQGYEFKTIENN